MGIQNKPVPLTDKLDQRPGQRRSDWRVALARKPQIPKAFRDKGSKFSQSTHTNFKANDRKK
jgi:hypothetical protein